MKLPQVATGARPRSDQGEHPASGRCRTPDLRGVDDEQYPFRFAYFTGSKAHNIVIRRVRPSAD